MLEFTEWARDILRRADEAARLYRGKMAGGLLNFLSCRQTSRLLAEGAFDGALGFVRFLAWLHLLYCRHCRRFKRELALLARAAEERSRGLVEPAALAALEARLIARLSQ